MSGSEPGYRTSDFDFPLPAEQIAQTPAARRDRSRLLVVDRASGALAHRVFGDLPEYLAPGDALVVNETRVFPARLLGRRESGAPAEVLLLTPEAGEEKLWRALVRPGAKLKPGRTMEVAPELSVEIVESTPGGERIVRVHTPLPLAEALDRYGEVPLPPYVARAATEEDRERYQTVYARERGSVAAPTAGLHFTPELLAELEAGGVRIVRLVLHVGVGTFRPVESEDPAAHPHARRVVPRPRRGSRGAEPGARGWRRHLRRGHHRGADAGDGGQRRRRDPRRARDGRTSSSARRIGSKPWTGW
jgi:S-adenosylmethionine:tRNA ribosyltransferase-isomerase